MSSIFSVDDSSVSYDPEFIRLAEGDGVETDYRIRFQTNWKRYQPFCAESDFLYRIKTDFLPHAWQMIMANHLLDHGFNLISPLKEGPDYQVAKEAEPPILIEAAAITPGSAEDRYPVGRTPPYYVEDEKIYLRIANTLQSKRNQYLKWLRRKIISDTQSYVVALFTGAIPDSSISSPRVTHLEQCLFAANLNSLQSGRTEVASVAERIYGVKHNGSHVHLNLFQDASFEEISGIISSTYSIYQTAAFQGQELHFIHNPNAKNPIPPGTFRFGMESWIENGELCRVQWKLGSPNSFSAVIAPVPKKETRTVSP